MKNLKKSLSLFLAVLMVLSCWVWVAPEKAEAATSQSTFNVSDNYKVTIGYTCSDDTTASAYFRMRVYYVTDNGYGSTTTNVADVNDSQFVGTSKTGDYTFTITVPGFPIFFEGVFSVSAAGTFSRNEASIEWNKLLIGSDYTESTDILTGGNKYTFTRGGWGATGEGDEKAFLNSLYSAPESADETTSISYDKPYIVGFNSSSSSPDPVSMSLNKIGGADVTKSATLSTGTYFDQYGVKWTASSKTYGTVEKSTYLSNVAIGDSELDSSKGGDYISAAATSTTDTAVTATVTAKAGLQENQIKSDGVFPSHLVHKWVGTLANGAKATSKCSVPVNVSYPKYTVSFNGAGSVSGLAYSLDLSDGSQMTATLNYSSYYKSTISGGVPKGTGTATGYTFKNLWTNPQPSSGNASYNALESDFAEPIDSDTFADYQTKGGTVSGNYITYNGVQYYNAGTKWDPSNKQIEGDVTYYGWWLADDLNVKFYDVDGTYLDTFTVKYNQTHSAIATWPTSKYTVYESGAFKYDVAAGYWIDTKGDEVSSTSYTFKSDLILTPKLTTSPGSVTKNYSVNFINPNNGSNIAGASTTYNYRDTALVETANKSVAAVPSDVLADLEFSYTFEGWSTTKPTTGKSYHVMLEDGDFDVNGNSIILNEDWIVRSDATYYPVYRRHVKTYVVEFYYKDATGADTSKQVKVAYGDTLTPPTDYVPYTYATGGFGYTFKEWQYSNADGDQTLAYNGKLTFTNDYISIAAGALDDGVDVTPIEINAAYGAPVATPYTVTFKSVNDKGEEVVQSAEVKNKEYITEEIVATLNPADTWEYDNALYTYSNTWRLTQGAAKLNDKDIVAGAEISTDELTELSPTSHITLEAVYGNPTAYYTVTYIDGTQTFTERVLDGSTLPNWSYKTTNDNGTPDDPGDDYDEWTPPHTPSMDDTAQGSYEFMGWYDAKQTDTTYTATNGNRYGSEGASTQEGITKVTSDVTLYPQFKFSPFTYTIKFMDYEGEVQLAAGEFEYGQNIEAVAAVANKAAQAREQDNTYTYTFIGWDKEVPTVCEGKDMVFIAQYKHTYRYYKANWYNSLAEMNNANSGEVDGTAVGLLATTNHTYNSKVYTPSVTTVCPETAPAGQNYVFDSWCYIDSNNEVQKYVRGMLITGNMDFYATYKLTPKMHTVTTNVKGTATTYQVADGSTADVVPTPLAGYVNADKHDAFDGWYTTSTFDEGTEFDIAATVISADTILYAKFIESDHEYNNEELVTAPTYYTTGTKSVWCTCDAKLTKQSTTIAMLTDTVKPTGTIYLGNQGSWSSTGTPAYETDNDPVSLYANADTDIIIIANDTGDVDSLYNPSGVGKGVKTIKAFALPGETALTAENYGAALEVAVTVYEDNTETLTNTANYIVKLGNLVVADLDENGDVQYNEDGSIKTKNLENGETYIVYYYVTDKAGNMLNRLVRTAKFIYDADTPVFTIEGNSNKSYVTGTPTYCETATVAGIEEGATLTVNGTVVATDAITWTTDETTKITTGTYKIEDADNYFVTVTDRAGNKTSKKFVIADEHAYEVKEVASTCLTDGYKTEVCLICKAEKEKVIYTHTGHIFEYAVVSATCTENGYSFAKCKNCDYSEKIYEVDGELIEPALGHNYPTKEVVTGEGEDAETTTEIVYTVATEPTCKAAGKETATCADCGHTLSREIPADTENGHNWGAIKTLKPTCTATGKKYQTCKLCYAQQDVEILDATGHETTQWVVTKEATCGEAGVETEQCTACLTYIGEYDMIWVIVDDVDDIPEKYECELDENGEPVKQVLESTDGTLTQTQYHCYVLDENGEKIFNYSTKEIPATGRHILAVSEDPDKTWDATTEKEGQITRYCTQCGHEWAEKVEKIVKYTVKFVDEDGTTEIKTISDIVSGTTITKNDITEPTKANSEDGKYKYTFAGWVGTDGKSVTLPIDVTSDITLKATYTESTIIYTHQFKVPTKWAATLDTTSNYSVFATLMGAMGDERAPVAVPTFSDEDSTTDAELKKLYTFKFKGWSTTGAVGDIVTDFTITGDTTFYAVFTAEAIAYDVIYYNGASFVWNTKVDGGESAEYKNYKTDENGDKVLDEDNNPIIVYPTKASTSTHHYVFDKWYTNATLNAESAYTGGAITATTRLYAGFTAIEHVWTVAKEQAKDADGNESVDENGDPILVDKIIEATCTTPKYVEYVCTCGATKTEAEGQALGHTADEPKQETAEDETVYSVVYCKVCSAELSRTKTSVTVVFENYNGTRLASHNLAVGADIKVVDKDGKDLAPTKSADSQYTYTFAGWYVKDDENQTIVDLTDVKAATDIVYVAKFTPVTRTFRVTYVDVNNNLLQTTTDIPYDGEVPVYTGETPVKSYDDDYHYAFDSWSVAAGSKVTSDLVIKPVFTKIAHTTTEKEGSDATCTQPGGGKIKECTCGYSYQVNSTTPALGHVKTVDYTDEYDYINGSTAVHYKNCSRCGEAFEDEKVANAEYTATLTDSGAVLANIVVELYKDGSPIAMKQTSAEGVVTFYIYETGSYEIKYANKTVNSATVDGKLNITTGATQPETPAEPEADDCSCTCHRDSFWGIIFRLFHKLIKIFTGKIGCCSCPDERY